MRFRSTVKQFDNQQSPESLCAKLSKGEKCALWSSPLIWLVLQRKYHSPLRVQRLMVAGIPISEKCPLFSFEISFLALRLRTLNFSWTDLSSSPIVFDELLTWSVAHLGAHVGVFCRKRAQETRRMRSRWRCVAMKSKKQCRVKSLKTEAEEKIQ